MEKKQAKEFVKEPKKRGRTPYATYLYRLALLLALLAVGFRPACAASDPPSARQQSTGYWRFIETDDGRSDPVTAPDTESLSVGASSMSGSVSHNPPNNRLTGIAPLKIGDVLRLGKTRLRLERPQG